MISVSQGRILTSELGHSYAEGLEGSESGLGPRLRVTVVFTTAEGTIAALRTAAGLAKNLGARMALVVTEVVPFHFPLDHPPVSIEFLERPPLTWFPNRVSKRRRSALRFTSAVTQSSACAKY